MRFSQAYSGPEKVLSLEFFPPKNRADLDTALRMIVDLSRLNPRFMTVTYGAGGSTRALTQEMVRYIHNNVRVPAVQHLTCVGHSASEIDHLVDELMGAGIRHVLALRGDPPKGQTAFVNHPEGFSCARDLVRHISKNRELSVAVAGYPETHRDARSREADIDYLKEKIDAGAEAVFTQLFFDPATYFRFVDDTAKAGIKVPVVPGIMPIGSISQIQRFTSLCGASIPRAVSEPLSKLDGDAEGVIEFGTNYAIRQCEALLRGGAPGIHLYTLNKSFQAQPIIEALGLGK